MHTERSRSAPSPSAPSASVGLRVALVPLVTLAIALFCASCRESAAPSGAKNERGAATAATTAATTAAATTAATGGTAAAAKPAKKCSPSCIDALKAEACGEDGTPAVVDCGARDRRCIRGVCAERLCKPDELHCDQGDLYQCNSVGNARKLVKACRPEGICLADPKKKGAASCVKSCDKSAENMVLATYDCAECDFTGLPFCAKTGPETSCSESLCNGGQLSFGAGMFECARDTDGLVVPGSEKKSPCEGGTARVQYDVCIDGKPVPRLRIDGC